MRKYSQKELLTEGFFDLIKKTKQAMSVIDPKATENLTRPFQQVRDVYRSFVPATKKYKSNVSKNNKQFAQKNPKIIKKIIDTEKNLYGRELNPTNISTVNIKLPSGKAVQNLIVVSKNLKNPNKAPEKFMYDKAGNFIKKL